jgi:phosphate transport system ATP-binding protein
MVWAKICVVAEERLLESLAPQTGAETQTKTQTETAAPEAVPVETAVAFDVRDVGVHYGDFQALHGVTLDIREQQITAFIGPSGCGKTTFLRCLNRMNDLVPRTRVDGTIRYRQANIYGANVDPIDVRRKIGMVFQKPNPFPKSIFENVAFAPRAGGVPRRQLPDLVERSLRSAALWDEVKDKLNQSAFALSGGQQQRLCIARALAIQPDALLMDEPCSALDPIATARIEDLMKDLKKQYTIAIVTHNMQQAARVSDVTAFFSTSETGTGGHLVEMDLTAKMFSSPSDPRTEEYITGRAG